MALVRFRWSLSCRGRFHKAVVAAFDVRMPFVARDQQESMLVTVRERSCARDLSAIIDIGSSGI
jgi:hypothetical protein